MNLPDKIIQLTSARCHIRDKVPRAELLAQLAEEATELAHAALKLRRALEATKNPTPVSVPTAVAATREEIADVMLLVSLLELDTAKDELQEIIDFKTLRWEGRLKERR